MLKGILNRQIYMLKSDKLSTPRMIWHTIAKKPAPILNMPTSIDENDIYICGPVWGGHPAAPIRYFMQNAPLAGKKVNMLLTARVGHVNYISNAEKMIRSTNCTLGKVAVFASDGEAIEDQVRELML